LGSWRGVERLLVKGPWPLYDETGTTTPWWEKTMIRPGVIVCERTGTWATALRRFLPDEIRLRQTRRLAECVDALAEAPDSLLALELSRSNLSAVLDLLAGLGQKFPRARAVVLAERGCEPYEWLVREAGAVHFTSSPRESETVARLVSRHRETIPASRASAVALIWDSLPWSDVAMS
jgi:hypothetical protein